MKRTTNKLTLLCTASLVALLAACAGGDGAAADSANDSAAAGTAGARADTGAGASGQATASGALLDPNAATREQLMALPGMDAATADSIIARRPFQNMLGVDSVLGRKFSEAQRDSIYERMFKPLDLNTASKEEIMLIPGVGERMHHEFEEYRPYQNIERFRREIAKYVADSTVRRYERYVTIRQP